jgi:hypothetical protein
MSQGDTIIVLFIRVSSILMSSLINRKSQKLGLAISAVVGGVLLTGGAVAAATTISTDISTGGMLSVTGTTTLAGNVGINTAAPADQVDIEGFGSVPFSNTAPSNQSSVVVINDTAAINPLEIHSANAQGIDL